MRAVPDGGASALFPGGVAVCVAFAGDPLELAPVVLGGDAADGAGARAHDERLAAGAAGDVLHAFQEVAASVTACGAPLERPALSTRAGWASSNCVGSPMELFACFGCVSAIEGLRTASAPSDQNRRRGSMAWARSSGRRQRQRVTLAASESPALNGDSRWGQRLSIHRMLPVGRAPK